MINQAKINKLDKNKVYQSIKAFPNQIEDVLSDSAKFSFPKKYYHASNIIISGMGGSLFNYYLVKSMFVQNLKIPLYPVNCYINPAFTNKNTLFIASSYSGNTEEVLNTTEDAIRQNGLVTAITSGGKLKQLVSKHKLPYYQFNPIHNQCSQPRIGFGYMIFGVLAILSKLKYLNLDSQQLKKSISGLKNTTDEILNLAVHIKEDIENKNIVYIAAEHLSGVVHIIRNQTNETAKQYSEYHLIPELNHHFMEGLSFPKNNNLLFVILKSNFYSKKNIKRFKITHQILQKQGFEVLDIEMDVDNIYSEVLYYLQFGAYLTYLMAIDYDIDPSIVPWVDYFKKQLAR